MDINYFWPNSWLCFKFMFLGIAIIRHLVPSQSLPIKIARVLVRMDISNKTSSESFEVHQLSSVGEKWAISLLQPVATDFPSQCLMAGQSLSYFFMLMVGTEATTWFHFHL